MADSANGIKLGTGNPCNGRPSWYVGTRKDPLPLRLASGATEEEIMSKPIIDADECVACGVCVDACPAGVLELQDVAE